MLPIFDILGPIVNKVLDFIPDPKQKLEAQQKLQEELMSHENEILKVMQASDTGQTAIDTEEAKSSNLFISGWRPFLGWTCGASFAWVYVVQPIVSFTLTAVGHPVPLPTLDFSAMSPILTGMLGLASLRTYEKQQGVSNTH